MAGIYIHIPFCRQACHYCNFHFATSLRYKNELLASLLKEAGLRRDYLAAEPIETIYIGGGTPSLLSLADIRAQVEGLRDIFPVSTQAEMTLEANPDDIRDELLAGWKEIGINRLSIGVQSFFEEDLRWMNRAHNAKQAIEGLQMARKYFDNITIDLIYGTPGLSHEKWKSNVDTALALGVPHLSCYALTVEPKTALQKMILKGESGNINPDLQSEQFILLMDWLETAGYEHYEISNFARPGWRSKHNASYWQGRHYLGLGPSAHSYNGVSRQWNISNNQTYIRSIREGNIPSETEWLTSSQQLNEYIMTSLRTIEGLNLDKLGEAEVKRLLAMSEKYVDRGLVTRNNNLLQLTREGKLLADGIAADLFV